MSYQKLLKCDKKFDVLLRLTGEDLVGIKVNVPLSVYGQVYVLPNWTVNHEMVRFLFPLLYPLTLSHIHFPLPLSSYILPHTHMISPHVILTTHTQPTPHTPCIHPYTRTRTLKNHTLTPVAFAGNWRFCKRARALAALLHRFARHTVGRTAPYSGRP